MFCTQCGLEIPDDAKVCPKCGYKLNDVVINIGDESPIVNKVSDEEQIAENFINQYREILKPLIGTIAIGKLKEDLIRKGQAYGVEREKEYINQTLEKIEYIENKKAEFSIEAKLADKIQKSYITDGLSRIDKVNGRFLASQTVKLDKIIEQNDMIIKLLTNINKNLEEK